MSLFERVAFEDFVQRLPHCFVVHQWGDASVAKVGTQERSKIFAILSSWSTDASAVSFKCSEMSFDMLGQLAGIRPAPYLARAKWVQVAAISDLEPEMLAGYITEAHRLAFLTLPKASREHLSAINPVA